MMTHVLNVYKETRSSTAGPSRRPSCATTKLAIVGAAIRARASFAETRLDNIILSTSYDKNKRCENKKRDLIQISKSKEMLIHRSMYVTVEHIVLLLTACSQIF